MGKRKGTDGLTPLELEVMQGLWDGGPATVQEVHRRVTAKRELAYNTVQTVLGILYRKGKVERRNHQRAYLYSPLVSRQQAGDSALQSLLDRLFGGRPEELVLSMVRNRQLSREKLAELQKLVEGDPDETS